MITKKCCKTVASENAAPCPLACHRLSFPCSLSSFFFSCLQVGDEEKMPMLMSMLTLMLMVMVMVKMILVGDDYGGQWS